MFLVLSVADTRGIHQVSAEYNLSNSADKHQEQKVSAEFRDLYPADTLTPLFPIGGQPTACCHITIEKLHSIAIKFYKQEAFFLFVDRFYPTLK